MTNGVVSQGQNSGWPATVSPFDKNHPGFCSDPYPTYAYMRQHHPVFYAEHLNTWVVTRAADVSAALKNPALGHRDEGTVVVTEEYGNGQGNLPPAIGALHRQNRDLIRLWLELRNPPDHTRLHRVLAPNFLARRLEPSIAAAQDATKHIIGQIPTDCPFDLLTRLLIPVAQAAANEFLSIPQEDGARLSRLAHFVEDTFDFQVDPHIYEIGSMALQNVRAYCQDFLHRPRSSLGAGLAGALRDATVAGEISDREAVANLVLVVIAAYVNMSRHLANVLHCLLQHQEQWQLLVQSPDRIAPGIEEASRYNATTLGILRRARTDTQIGVQKIKVGSLVLLATASANRDPMLHPNPDRLDVNRDTVRHWVFGEGLHSCLGAALSRGVARTIVTELVRDVPGLTLAAPVEYCPAYIRRAPTALVVSAT